MSDFLASTEATTPINAKFGSTEGIHFDHYAEDWDFGQSLAKYH